jgi:hypothetical protein
MTLSVIGAGLPRTGTLSLKLALEELGLGPCYRMMDMILRPDVMAHWAAAKRGTVDWDKIFAGYQSAVDWPVCDHYRELAEWYSEAKVILTIRDADLWFASTQNTIFSSFNNLFEQQSPIGEIVRGIANRHFGGTIHDRFLLIEGYKRHIAEVRSTIPAQRLLQFDVAEGWDPLCEFLGRPVPNKPFPSANSTSEFQQRAAQLIAQSGVSSPPQSSDPAT